MKSKSHSRQIKKILMQVQFLRIQTDEIIVNYFLKKVVDILFRLKEIHIV